MKNLKVLFILLLALPFCMSCNNDDDNAGNNPPITDPLHGKWTLVMVDGGFAGVHNEFNEGVIVWDFDTTTETIVVVNNNPADLYDALGTGDYDYEFVPNTVTIEQCSTALEVTQENNEMVYNFGCKDIEGTTLTLTQIGADGFVHTFKKVNP